MINPTQLGFSNLPLSGFSPMMTPSMMMGGGMDINQLMMYLQQLMMGQNGGNLAGMLNPAGGTFPMADPGFGKGEVGAGGGGGGSIDDSFRNNFSTGSGGAGILNSFLGGGSGMGGMMSSLMGGVMGGLTGGGNTGGGFTGGSFTGGGFHGGANTGGVFTGGGVSAGGSTNVSSGMTAPNVTGGVGRIAIANELMAKVESGQLTLPKIHPSQVSNDGATPYDNIRDTAAGKATLTSAYGDAGGAPTYLDGRMLNALNELSDKYNLNVSSIAGADHSDHSRHYSGLGFDVNYINGQKVDINHPDYKAFMADAKALGATEVLGPGDAGHPGHVHVAFSRDNAQNGPFTQAEIDEQQANVKAKADALAGAETPEGVVRGARDLDQAIETGKDAVKAAQKADDAKKAESNESKTDSGSSKDKSSDSSSSSTSSSDSKSSSKTSSDSGSSSSSSSDSSSSSSKSESKSSSSSSSSSKSESKSSSSSSSSSGSSGSSSSGSSSKDK